MKTNEFAILHNPDGEQILITTDFNHESDVNGYAETRLTWSSDKKQSFEDTFDKFKDLEYCKKWIQGLKDKLTK